MIVVDAGETEARSPLSRRRTLRRVAAVLAVLALVWAGTRVVQYWHDRAPYSSTAVAAHVAARVVGVQQSQAAIDRLVGPGRLTTVEPTGSDDRRQVVVGQVMFRTPLPQTRHGEYALFVLDKMAGNAPVWQMWGVGPPGTNVGQGWESAYNDAAHRYRWLSTLATVHSSSGWTDPGMAVGFPASTPGPVTFSAILRSTAAGTDPARRVTVALVFLSDSGHAYWADRLLG